MSVKTELSGVASILKPYSPAGRSQTIQNKVRFKDPPCMSVEYVIHGVLNEKNVVQYEEFIFKLSRKTLEDEEFTKIFVDAKKCIHLLDSCFSHLVESLLSQEWLNRNEEAANSYENFLLELIVARNNYTTIAITKLIKHLIPKDEDEDQWNLGVPSEKCQQTLKKIHNFLVKLLSVIPMIYDILLPQLRILFPYFKKPTHVVAGYLYNLLWITKYASVFKEDILDIVFNKLLLIDVNAPRSEIEDAEYEGKQEDESMFEMEEDNLENMEDEKMCDMMKHQVAETLDVCMEQMFAYLEQNIKEDSSKVDKLFQMLLNMFDNHILPTHNTHHVQFCVFYFCSFNLTHAEQFINILWKKVCNPNMSTNIRQVSIGYLASTLARAKYVPLKTLKFMLSEFSLWCHQYIQKCDSMHNNNSIKAHLVFYSICQALFYIIAFRSKSLTASRKNLIFLQSLQLSSIVTCVLNPLRVCLPAVATAFGGVTRAHQLAYCQTILERNARRKLATIYSNEQQTSVECLETFFPFDPYLLKKSRKRVDDIYLQYQPVDMEEEEPILDHCGKGRKRIESISEDVDDFLQDKRQRMRESSGKSVDNDMQFTYSYGVSPGFHN